MANTVYYPVKNGLYVNLTNQCSCACVFCIRSNGDSVYGSDSLWLDEEPTAQRAVELLDAYMASLGSRGDSQEDSREGVQEEDAEASRPQELVFCGYGEPTERLDVLLAVARHAREVYKLSVRVNTNGQGSLINGRDIVSDLAQVVDAVSVSLNAPNAARYQEITRSEFGEAAFDQMLRFAAASRDAGMQVTMTSVSTFLTDEEEARCQEICDELGVRYRVRIYEG